MIFEPIKNQAGVSSSVRIFFFIAQKRQKQTLIKPPKRSDDVVIFVKSLFFDFAEFIPLPYPGQSLFCPVIALLHRVGVKKQIKLKVVIGITVAFAKGIVWDCFGSGGAERVGF